MLLLLYIHNIYVIHIILSGSREYTATTENATNTITAVATDNNAGIAITVNGNSISSGQSATWESGTNTVIITVTNGNAAKTYTITVTKGE